jgi:hypothetical protein
MYYLDMVTEDNLHGCISTSLIFEVMSSDRFEIVGHCQVLKRVFVA